MDKKITTATGQTRLSVMFGLIVIFGVVLSFMAIDQILCAHLIPGLKNIITASNNIDAVSASNMFIYIDKFMSVLDIVPFVMVILIPMYMIISAIRRERIEREEYYRVLRRNKKKWI